MTERFLLLGFLSIVAGCGTQTTSSVDAAKSQLKLFFDESSVDALSIASADHHLKDGFNFSHHFRICVSDRNQISAFAKANSLETLKHYHSFQPNDLPDWYVPETALPDAQWVGYYGRGETLAMRFSDSSNCFFVEFIHL